LHLTKSIDIPDVSTLGSLSEALAKTDAAVCPDATTAPIVTGRMNPNSLKNQELRRLFAGRSG